MPPAARYPANLLAATDLGTPVVNFQELVLSGDHTAVVTTITLTATVPATWPTAGRVTIDTEVIIYTGKTGATLTGCTRGSEGTTAATHSSAAIVGMYWTADQFNQLAIDLSAVETQLGKNFTSHRAGGNATGATTHDLSLGDTTGYTLTGNVTFTFTNPTAGHYYTFVLTQDGTGSRLVTWPTIKWVGGTAPTLSTAASKIDIITVYTDGTTYYGSSQLNFA